MDVAALARTRYTTKKFDPARRIPDEQVAELETLMHLSPSSTNAQPWHFVVAGTEEGKARVAKAMAGFCSFNEPKVLNASHVVVFCAKAAIDEAYLDRVLDREDEQGRFAMPEARAGQHNGRSYFVNSHRFELSDVQHWAEKQVYLTVGALLLGAAALGVDACAMEGFDHRALNEEFGLRGQGLTSAVVVALGYRSAEDFNATLPKSRLPLETVITRI